MSEAQERSISQLERRLGWTRRESLGFAEGKVPGFRRDVGLREIDADHLILLLSDLDCRANGDRK